MADKDFIKEVFQRATEEFDIEFNPVAWERMETKLNQERRKRVLFYWLRWGALALVLLLSAWLFWQYFNPQKYKSKVDDPTLPVVEMPKIEEEFCPENQAIAEEGMKNERMKNERMKNGRMKNEKLLENKTERNNIKTDANERSILRKINKKVNKSQINDNNFALQKEQVKNNLAILDSAQHKLDSESLNNPTLFNTVIITNLEFLAIESQERNEFITIPSSFTDTTDVIKPNLTPKNRWTLGLLAAPEKVSVGFNDITRNGFSYGLLTEYRFAPRFSLSAQGLYAKKNYVAGEGEYIRAYGWPQGIAPIQTIGNCEMIEATLGLRTELLQRPRWNLVANTGVSTWWMLQEDYRYKYGPHDPNQKPIYKWKSKEPITHWFGVAQLSIGTEIKLSQKISVQADLYTQVPLQGLGHGQLKLYSNGLSFSLRRRF